jgi:hypothetical protein
MGALFRVLAIIEFIGIGLVTASKFLAGVLGGEFFAAIVALIVGLIAVLFALPLYVLGNVVDELRVLQAKVFAPAPMNEEAHNRKLIASGGWKCSCGRVNADYVSTCACGKNRHEEKL